MTPKKKVKLFLKELEGQKERFEIELTHAKSVGFYVGEKMLQTRLNDVNRVINTLMLIYPQKAVK